MFVYIQHREHSVESYFQVCVLRQSRSDKIHFFSLRIFMFSFVFVCRELKMAYLLMSVILLHLITLAMLFVATMEKVVIRFDI